MTDQPMTAPPMMDYPVRFGVEYPDSHSRLLIFVKWLLAIPHFLILYVFGTLGNIIVIIAFFAILFTKRYPRGLFNMYVGIQRWTQNVYSYAIFLMCDDYPPFSWDSGNYPLTFEVDYPEELSRFAPLYKWLLALPHYIVLIFLWVIGFILLFVGWFAILFTGHLPRGIFNYLEGMIRWSARVSAYVYLLTDAYPPFSMK